MSDNLENLPEKYPCPICGEMKKIGISKKDKPYYFCDLCGVQVFIRGRIGINKLSEINASGVLDRLGTNNSATDALKVIQLENKISFIKLKIEEFNQKSWDSELSKREEIIKDDLTEQLKKLENQYLTKLSDLST